MWRNRDVRLAVNMIKEESDMIHSDDISQFFAKTILPDCHQLHQNKVRIYNREQGAYLYLSTNCTEHGLSEV